MRLIALLELLPAALDSQLRHDANLTSFDYLVLAMLSQAPEHTLQMTDLARQTSSTPARLSNVVKRLEHRGIVERFSSVQDKRVKNARLSAAGWAAVQATAPTHVAYVRDIVIDALTPTQLTQLAVIIDAVLARLDPEGLLGDVYRGYSSEPHEGLHPG